MDAHINTNDSSCPTIQDEKLYLASSKFQSCDDLLKSARAFYFEKGYGLSIRDSKKDKSITLQCHLSGSYRDTHSIALKRKKSTGTRLTNCPFRIVGKKVSDGTWVFQVTDLTHNHERSNMSELPSICRLPPDDIESVKEMTMSGIPPRQVLSSLRQKKKDVPANSRTIYNLKAKLSKDSLKNRTKVSALFEELKNAGFIYDIKHNPQGVITRLFIVHPLSIRLAKLFPNIFVMDCTYKTNRYNMPLLDIIGITCFNTSFYSGFAFLDKEDEDNYKWALRAFKKILVEGNGPSVIMTDRELALINGIKAVFPNTTSLLCVWHINKNVFSHCKKLFGRAEEFNIFMSSWNNVVYSTTHAIFKENWDEFVLTYKEKGDAIEYIKDTWFFRKEKFVSAWTEKYLHFGNRATSRAEGAHAKLKLYLQASTGGFREVKDKFSHAVEHAFKEIKVKLASERIQVPHDCNIPFFREVLCQVSKFALKEIYQKYEKFKEGIIYPCTGQYTTTMGLPCAHKLSQLELEGLSLPLDLINLHWRIDTLSLNSEDVLDNDDANKFGTLVNELSSRYQGWPLHKKEYATLMITNLLNESEIFFEPVVQQPKGRPPTSKKKKGKTCTNRDPSRFEYVESSQTHNPSSSNCVSQRNNESIDESIYIHHENNFIDSNVYPSFSSEFMPLE